MSGSEVSVDLTDSKDFIWDQADRFIAWDMIHVRACAEAKLPAWVIAERVGLDTEDIHEIVDDAIAKILP